MPGIKKEPLAFLSGLTRITMTSAVYQQMVDVTMTLIVREKVALNIYVPLSTISHFILPANGESVITPINTILNVNAFKENANGVDREG